jgi:hypothetical protein
VSASVPQLTVSSSESRAKMLSAPPWPFRVSVPAPPVMKSESPPPLIVSMPARPSSSLKPPLPVMVSPDGDPMADSIWIRVSAPSPPDVCGVARSTVTPEGASS